ncbi:histidine kinase [bacterium]|nr:histidine kinase [bacterium]MBT6777564.1 histidine kinase [bacterium]
MKENSFNISHSDNFNELMVHRVHEILLVASPYDAFILEEDGGLTEQIMTEYIGMNFNYAPRVTRSSTAASAMNDLSKNNFDLVIVMLRIEDTDPISLGKSIKKKYPNMPVILLAFDETEIKQFTPRISPSSINRIFIWSGDASVFPAIIKYVEDRKNAEKDIIQGNVRAIILIEDSPRMYSILLPLIYREIVSLTKTLMKKTFSSTYKSMHLRGRIKVLLTPNFETAEKFSNKYGDNIVGIISDVKFLNNGKKDSKAGARFAKSIREKHPSMPIMLQSTDNSNRKLAKELGTDFLHKESNTLLNDLRNFMLINFGFGDFIFKDNQGNGLLKATNIEDLIEGIKTVPIATIILHGKSNHFSNWVAARSNFDLATQLRKINVQKFSNKEDIRAMIIEEINNLKQQHKFGEVSDFSPENGKSSRFYKMCGGSLGGKARGLAFAKDMIIQSGINNKFKNINVKIPKTAIIGTEEFDRFMKDNKLWDNALKANNNKDVETMFLKSRLSMELTLKVEAFLKNCNYPLAVRSSSLLEDSQYQPLSGAYSTFMLPNNQAIFKDRINQLIDAIKLVFASIFYIESKSYFANSAHRTEEEKMAVILMEIAGQEYAGGRFYPTFSGVLKSINFYPVSYMKRDEGVCYLALGFGKTIVDGGKCLGISPKYPAIKPQFSTIKSTLVNSQSSFYSLEMDGANFKLKNDLKLLNLSKAEIDKSLDWLGGVITSDDNILRNSLSYKGTRVVNFSPILDWKIIPLCEILNELLILGKQALGCPVEIEFAVNMRKNEPSEFYLLQIKPMLISTNKAIDEESFRKRDIFASSHITLGNGSTNQIKDLLYLSPDKYDPSKSLDIAKEIEFFNNKMGKNRPYILVGPGRWGSSDPWLGVPINWQQISNTKMILELGHQDFPVDPSFGSHFFQNIISLHIGYLTIDHKNKNDFLNSKWLEKNHPKEEKNYISWYQFKEPFRSIIDGLSGTGKVIIPKPETIEIMDEEDSSGI